MTTETKEFAPLEDKTRALSPLLVLLVGGNLDGVLKRVNMSEDDDKPGKFRKYYEFILLADTKGEDKDHAKMNCAKGDIITLPGTGGLDFALDAIVREYAKMKDGEQVKDFSVLYGDRFIIERKPDEKMSKGKHEGKPVKTWAVKHARAVRAK